MRRSIRPWPFSSPESYVTRGKNRLVQGRFNIPAEVGLVVLDREYVVTATACYGGAERLLAEHRVAGDDLVLQVDLLEQFEGVGNLQALAVGRLGASGAVPLRDMRL
jgi:hypothetical protein